MTYRIRLLVPSSYADEARIMIEEHPRAAVVERHSGAFQPGADLLIVVSSDPRILHGLHRWWQNHRSERRATPPLALVQSDDSMLTFNDHSANELEACGRRDAWSEAV